MTLLTAWTTFDSRAPSSAYIATDSRVSFHRDAGTWDYARKCFASSSFPDLFGYVGQVLLPSQVLSQFVSAIDAIGKNGATHSFERRNQGLFETVIEAVDDLPKRQRHDFEIVHIGREGEGLGSIFHTHVISCTGGKVELEKKHSSDRSVVMEFGTAVVQETEPILKRGSGTAALGKALGQWNSSEHSHTSRAAFSAHCDVIAAGRVASVGGYPQLVGLIRKGNGIQFGVVSPRWRFAMGFEALSAAVGESIQYRNELFEVVDSEGRPLPGAARHSRPT